MDTPKLTQTPLRTAAGAVTALTLAGATAERLAPELAGKVAPHPTLYGTPGEWLGTAMGNARVLVAPFLLCLLGLHRTRAARTVGDLLVASVVAVNTIPVGVELGRWRGRLLPYIPQLPLEWAALSIAVGAWLTIRSGLTSKRDIAVLAAAAAALTIAAAALETWGTPHHAITHATNQADTIHGGPGRCGGPGVDIATDYAPGRAGRCKVTRSLPLPTVGSASPDPALTGLLSTTPGPPQGGQP